MNEDPSASSTTSRGSREAGRWVLISGSPAPGRVPIRPAHRVPSAATGPEGAYISYQGYAMPCCMVATPTASTSATWRSRAFTPSGRGGLPGVPAAARLGGAAGGMPRLRHLLWDVLGAEHMASRSSLSRRHKLGHPALPHRGIPGASNWATCCAPFGLELCGRRSPCPHHAYRPTLGRELCRSVLRLPDGFIAFPARRACRRRVPGPGG
jgi:hypothetical protein